MSRGAGRRRLWTGASLLAFTLFWPLGAAADPTSATVPLLRCYDRTLDTVTLTTNCAGEIVTEAQQREIEQRRIERIRRAIRPSTPARPGQKLVMLGTGFLITSDGKALTNNHVIDGCAGYRVEGHDGAGTATLLGADADNDLALLQTSFHPATFARFRSPDAVMTGIAVGVVGYPNLGLPRIEPLFTPGMVIGSAVHKGKPPRLVLKVDIRHGNSGGPVLDESGAVIGVIQAKINSPAVYEKLHQVVEDIGLAITETSVLHFLHSHGVGYRLAGSEPPLDQTALFQTASTFVIRVGCLK